jgi:hypothetical protein
MSFLSLRDKNYASIVAGFKKVASDLTTYIKEQQEKIKTLSGEKTEIESKIHTSKNEITKSEYTAGKIGELIMMDLDDNGLTDVDELPDEEEPPAE